MFSQGAGGGGRARPGTERQGSARLQGGSSVPPATRGLGRGRLAPIPFEHPRTPSMVCDVLRIHEVVITTLLSNKVVMTEVGIDTGRAGTQLGHRHVASSNIDRA